MPASSAEAVSRPRVVVVDLDNTLIKADTLHEQLVRIVFQKPRLLPRILGALFRGKAAFKDCCAEAIVLEPANLRTCDEVLSYLADEKSRGSFLVLCTAADHRVARLVADHLGIFDEVIATESGVNLKGEAKAAMLVRRFPDGFVYAGDHASDLAVWAKAEGIVLVGVSASVARRASALGKPIIAEFRSRADRPNPLHVWPRALRVHHWSKNLLMFVPLILGHAWDDVGKLVYTALGFVLLLLVSSSSYLVNDIADIDSDRRHLTKRFRPVASGQLPLLQAVLFPVVVIPCALMAALILDPGFAAALTAYLILTLAYSFGLKRIPLLDTFIIAVLFTLRLVMGVALLNQSLPIWLLTFSMFFFFSLATAKRHVEIIQARTAKDSMLRGRGYEADDWPLTLAFGIGSGLASLVILVLYMVDEAFRAVGYARPEFLWAVALLVAIWIGRIWLLTHRGRMHDDPVSFALRDWPSRFLAICAAACFLAAL